MSESDVAPFWFPLVLTSNPNPNPNPSQPLCRSRSELNVSKINLLYVDGGLYAPETFGDFPGNVQHIGLPASQSIGHRFLQKKIDQQKSRLVLQFLKLYNPEGLRVAEKIDRGSVLELQHWTVFRVNVFSVGFSRSRL